MEIKKINGYTLKDEIARDKIDFLNSGGGDGFIAISRNIDDNIHRLYYSKDGINFYRVKGTNYNNVVSDASSMILINGRYYYFGSNVYQFSNDLVNFTNEKQIINENNDIWASFPFYDKPNNKYYVYHAYRYNQETFINACGQPAFYFKIIAQEFTINPDGVLNFGNIQDVKYISGSSYIDPSIVYTDTRGYVMAIKNEQTCQMEIYSMVNPLQLNQEPILTIRGAGTEAGKLIEFDDIIHLYAHDYGLGIDYYSHLGDLPQTYSRIPIYTPRGIIDDRNALREVCYSPETFRHAGIMKATNEILNIIKNLGVEITKLYPCGDYYTNEEIKTYKGVHTSGQTYEVINHPCVIYGLGGGTGIDQITLNMRAYYKSPLYLLSGPTNIKFSGDTNAERTIVNEASNSDGDNIIIGLAPSGKFYTPLKF